MSLEVFFGAIGTALGLVRALPQLARLLRTRDAHGVSLDTATTSAIVSSGWATYGVMTEQVPVALATGSSAIVFAAVAVASVRYGRRLTELRASPLWLAVLLGALAIGGSDGLAVFLPVSVLVANLPQLIVAYKEPDLTALSLGTWSLSMADGIVWGLYALAADDRAILLYGVLQLSTSGLIVMRRTSWARAARAPNSRLREREKGEGREGAGRRRR